MHQFGLKILYFLLCVSVCASSLCSQLLLFFYRRAIIGEKTTLRAAEFKTDTYP
jgi:hypothetical protein